MFKPYKGSDVDNSYACIQGVWMRLKINPKSTWDYIGKVSLECLGWGVSPNLEEFSFSSTEKAVLKRKLRESSPGISIR